MSSSERLLGEFLLECIQASPPVPVPESMTLEETTHLIFFAHNVTYFVKCFQAQLSQSKKAESGRETPAGTDDVISGLACLIYDVVSKDKASLELQLKQLEEYLTKVNQIEAVLKTFGTPLANIVFEAFTFDTKKNSILQSLSEPYAIRLLSSTLAYLVERIKISIQQSSPVLEPEDLVNVLGDSQKKSFYDELNQHFTAEKRTNCIQAIQTELDKPDTSFEEKKDTFQQIDLEMRALVKKNTADLSSLKTLLKKLLDDSNKTLLSLQSKKTKGKKSYREINETLEKECKEYREKLVQIDQNCKQHELADENSAPFIKEQFTAIQTSTNEIKTQSANIEKLDSTRSNWFLQKLSNWIRRFCKFIDKPLPQWNWLHNENAGRLNTLFETVHQSIEARDLSDKSKSISIPSNTSHGASALLAQPAPQPVQHSATTTTDKDPTKIPQLATHPTAKIRPQNY